MNNIPEQFGSTSGDRPGADSTDSLSPVARARRDAMLPLLSEVVVCEGRRRGRRRVALRCTCLLAGAFVIGTTWVAFDGSASRRITGLQHPGAEANWGGYRVVSILRSRPSALERFSVATSTSRTAYTIDDKQLVNALSAIGRPAGLIQSGDSIRFTEPVTDREIHAVLSAAGPTTVNSAVGASGQRGG